MVRITKEKCEKNGVEVIVLMDIKWLNSLNTQEQWGYAN